MKVTILDTVTGEKREMNEPFDSLWWVEGNGSCDCNRSIFMGFEGEDFGRCDGCHRFLIIDAEDKSFSLYDYNEDYPEELLTKHGIELVSALAGNT